ncbi:hypothetical protein [Streptomyces sp. PD-S100-1]|uniref:hypothetical protein n=1 Tax=Streptomyces sp. PD-S100-1 TaxID=3394351 RepID=UPI0039BD2DEB
MPAGRGPGAGRARAGLTVTVAWRSVSPVSGLTGPAMTDDGDAVERVAPSPDG